MKRYLLIALMALGMLGLTSCNDDDYWYLPTGMWTILDEYGNPTPSTLAFNGATVAVQECGPINGWPLEDGLWGYYIDDKNRMHVSYDYWYYDADGDYVNSSRSYVLAVDMPQELTTMTLAYKPVIGHTRYFYLQRI